MNGRLWLDLPFGLFLFAPLHHFLVDIHLEQYLKVLGEVETILGWAIVRRTELPRFLRYPSAPYCEFVL
jgi:hypothetical protein